MHVRWNIIPVGKLVKSGYNLFLGKKMILEFDKHAIAIGRLHWAATIRLGSILYMTQSGQKSLIHIFS